MTTPPPTDPAAYVAVADSFMDARVAGDGDGAVALIGDYSRVDSLVAEEDALGGRDFWGCPVGSLGG